MIVTNDLDIIADTKDGKKLIFKKGHFNIQYIIIYGNTGEILYEKN